jgi:ankyrin repeat protein
MSGYINAFDVYDHNLRGRDTAPEVAARETPSLEKNLFMASSKGQLGRVSAILRSSDSIDLFAKVNGLTSLHSAAKKGFADVCKALLSYPKEAADVSRLVLMRTDGEAKTALMLAAFHGQLETVRVLVSSTNAHLPLTDIVGAKDGKGNTCLHYAAWGGHIECVQYFGDLLGAEALDVQNDEGLTPLQLATAGDFHAIVAYITQKTQDCGISSDCGSSIPNVSGEVSSSGMTALHRAASHGAYDTANYILKLSRISVNQQANNGNTALHYAAQHGHKTIVQLLIQQPSVDISIANEYGLSPFHYACLG